ncbi:MAG: hypothetical protein NWE95_01765 [Candidatus Bathyarchaeota archaeon]|nr:hypothetical protein [Candidatus Bathyarchaeota archaeon]
MKNGDLAKIVLTKLRIDSRATEDELTVTLKDKFPAIGEQTVRDNVIKTVQSCVLRRVGILNPNALVDKGVYPFLIFIAADDYKKVRSLIEERKLEGSWFSLYGHDDYLCKIYCSSGFLDELLTELEKYCRVSYFQADCIHVDSGFTVSRQFKAPDSEDIEAVDKLQSNAASTIVPLDVKIRLLKQSIFVGYGILEDYTKSGVIKAVVGITFRRGATIRDIRHFIHRILNSEYRENITGLYEGKGKIIDYELVIELLFEDYYELNTFTEELYSLGNVDTSTHLIAEPIKQEIALWNKLHISEEVPEDVSRWANKILKEIYESLPPEYHATLRNMNENEKSILMSRYRLLHFSYYGKAKEDRNLGKIQDAIKQLMVGMVTRKETHIAYSFTTLTRALETELYNLIKLNGEMVIGPDWETELKKALHKDPKRSFSLGTYLEIIPYWKANYGFCPLGITDSDLNQIERINKYRGPRVHGGPQLIEEEFIPEDKMEDFFFLVYNAIKLLLSIENVNIEQNQDSSLVKKSLSVMTFISRKVEADKLQEENLVKELKRIVEEKPNREEVIERLDKIESIVSKKDKRFFSALKFTAGAISEEMIGEVIRVAIKILTGAGS